MDEALAILIAEDDPNDGYLLQRAFKKAGFKGTIYISKDGEEAKEYLRGDGDFADRTKFPPARVLLTDLKMPRCDGFELLRWLRDNPSCRVIPTVVFSASAQEQDVTRAYELGANCYFCKPSHFDRLVAIVELLAKFWDEALLPRVPQKCV